MFIEVKKSWPIKKDIFTGLEKIIKQISEKTEDGDDGATFSYDRCKELVSFVHELKKAIGNGSQFDEFHMENADLNTAEISALFGELA